MKFVIHRALPSAQKTGTDQRGFILVAAIVLLALLSLIGTAAYLLSSTDIKIGGNYRNTQRVLQVAIAGTEHGREVLRTVNATDTTPFTDPTTLNAELAYYAGANLNFEFDAPGSDDLPLASGSAGGISYVAYLSNDAIDMANGTPISDSNNKVQIRSIATSNGSKAVVEITVSLPPPPPIPPPLMIPPPLAMVSMPGNSASFLGGNSNAKTLNGDDQCGDATPLPVIAPTDGGSLGGIQSEINNTKPKTYHTKLPSGQPVDATTHMNEVAKTITPGQINSVMANYGTNLVDAGSLNALIQSVKDFILGNPTKGFIAPGGSTSQTVDLGNNSNLRLVLVEGDFEAKPATSGAGLLVVKGQLTYDGTFNYTGLIMVIGKGAMVRTGGGNGTVSGAIWVANTAGPDGIPGNADDVMGMSILNTSGQGTSNLQYCSSAVNNSIATTTPPPTYQPLAVRSFKHVF
ncbi:MAG: pilus assembly PilX N-terminal domain-containing protein [Deltaproteobacteria bacterium]|nr:pilus assembly PilX N-terminal domain-containing protein [Deltaproteobacteria bacterium]